MGKPIVATHVGGNTEAIIDGVTGFLVPRRDPEGIANAVLKLLNDPGLAERFGRNSRERAEKLFSLNGMVENMQDLYESLLRKKGIFNDT